MIIDYEIIKNNFFIIYDFENIFFDDTLPEKIKIAYNKCLEQELIFIVKLDYYFKYILSLSIKDENFINKQVNIILNFKKDMSLPILIEMNNYHEFGKFIDLVDIIMIHSHQFKETNIIRQICVDGKIICIKNNIFGSYININFLYKLINSYENPKLIICESSKTNYLEVPDYLKLKIFNYNKLDNNTLTCIDISDNDFNLDKCEINLSYLNFRNNIPLLSNIFLGTKINGFFISGHNNTFDFNKFEILLKNIKCLIK